MVDASEEKPVVLKDEPRLTKGNTKIKLVCLISVFRRSPCELIRNYSFVKAAQILQRTSKHNTFEVTTFCLLVRRFKNQDVDKSRYRNRPR